jgi:hypothetical protein
MEQRGVVASIRSLCSGVIFLADGIASKDLHEGEQTLYSSFLPLGEPGFIVGVLVSIDDELSNISIFTGLLAALGRPSVIPGITEQWLELTAMYCSFSMTNLVSLLRSLRCLTLC